MLGLWVNVQPAGAITNGTADGTKHPAVGALVGTFDGETYPYCSGVLVSPTVLVTTAHCDIGTAQVNVTFDSVYTSGAQLYVGAFTANPRYNKTSSDPRDVGVVVFSQAIQGVTPAQLPTRNSLDRLPKDQKFTAVGYGGTVPHHAPGGPVVTYPDTRMYAVSTLNAINPAWLRLSQNSSTGNGGTCGGDSGGPNFLGAGSNETRIAAAITITGDIPCKATNVDYRLDTDSARQFLGQFVTLP
jgi:hypothetical protein